MSTIIQQPDSLSFSGNLKKFEITSLTEIIFELKQVMLVNGSVIEKMILSEKYNPDADGLLTIDIKAVIERLLEITIPSTRNILTEQPVAVGNFFARVDSIAIPLTVIKGGVAELQEMAATWLAAHFLTWQPQEKLILQSAPEWLGIYPIAVGTVKLKAYYADGTSYTGDYASPSQDKLYSINTSWGNVSEWLAVKLQNTQAISWDVWFEVDNVRMTPIQRYQLRNPGDEEHVFLWANTLGGIDSVSFTGSQEQDAKLEHRNALYENKTIGEYDIDQAREIRQSTGFLDSEKSRWIEDFFYSRKKYKVRNDGSLKQIAVTDSKVVRNSADDEFDYEFTYRYGEDTQLLNLERTLDPLQPPEGLADFFLTELLSGLTSALYADNLLMAVQSPFAQGWQKLTFAQLFNAALPSLVDGWSIKFIDGKLIAIGGTGGTGLDATAIQDLRDYINSLTVNVNDTRTELISGAILWDSGLTYNSTEIIYKILGVKYLANKKRITLDAADPNLSRIDVFYVDMFGSLQRQTGIAAVNPTKPTLLSTQLEVMTALIGPGALEPSNVDIEKVYDENIEWITSEIHDTNISVGFDSLTEPLNGTKRIQVKIDVPDSAINKPGHYLGEPYQGGKIFYYDEKTGKGLIAAVNNTAVNEHWAMISGFSTYTTGASGIDIGTGQANTALMLLKDAAKNEAVKYCDELVIDGFADWFLPSEKELYELYIRRFEVGNFAGQTFWSSTEVTGSNDWKKARCISFADGTAYTRDKNNAFSVRAIRAFDDATLPTNAPVPSFKPTGTTLSFKTETPVAVNAGILSLNIKSSKPWLFNSMLLIESYLGEVKTGTISMAATTNLFNYKPGDENWQMIALQMYQFAPTQTTLDGFKISLVGAWPNNIDLGIDDIRYQHSDIVTTAEPVGIPDEIPFEFRDIEAGTATSYDLDIKASVKYTIEAAVLETDDGTLTGVNIKINSTSVTGLSNLTVDTAVDETASTGAKTVVEGDRVKLFVTSGYTGSPTLIRGKLKILLK